VGSKVTTFSGFSFSLKRTYRVFLELMRIYLARNPYKPLCSIYEMVNEEKPDKVGQEQIHDLLFSEQLSWQAIIYDLVNSEQLDPWDIDIAILVEGYLSKVRGLEEANFFVSSKVLFAASLLLRMKSDILLYRELPGLDDILFGKKEERKYQQERIDLDEEIPEIIPRTPLPRYKKVTLPELMEALGKAIKTENRRIKREVVLKQYEREAEVILPKNTINLDERIRDIYSRIKDVFKDRDDRFPFSEFKHKTKEEKIMNFVSLLHLDNQHRIWLEQDNHFGDIWIWLNSLYKKKNAETLERMAKEVAEEIVGAERKET